MLNQHSEFYFSLPPNVFFVVVVVVVVLSLTNAFQDLECVIVLPFHTVHGVINERILKWFAIHLSSGTYFVRTLHHDPFILGGPTWHGS